MDPDPVAVGNNFVMRYYTVLNRNPELLHHFYNERSIMTFGYEDEPQGQTAKGLEKIHQRVLDNEFKDCTVDLSVLDCQGSVNGSVFISAIGYLNQGDAYSRRKFMHNFFLERTVNGTDISYYVLNDVFRFLSLYDDEEDDQEPEEEDEEEQDEQHESAQHDQQKSNHLSEAQSRQETAPTAIAVQPSKPVEVTKTETVSQSPASEQRREERSLQQPSASKTEAVRESNNERAGPKSSKPSTWASLVSKTQPATENTPHEPQQTSSRPAAAQQPQPQQQANSNNSNSQSSGPVATDAPKNTSPAVTIPSVNRPPGPFLRPGSPVLTEGCSIFASNVPYDAKQEQLITVFSKYNKVRHVVLKSAKGFAFIEFENPQAMQAAWKAMQANPPAIEGRQLTVEERKPKASPVVSRSTSGRGSRSFRGTRSSPSFGDEQQQAPTNEKTGEPPGKTRNYGFGSSKGRDSPPVFGRGQGSQSGNGGNGGNGENTKPVAFGRGSGRKS